MLGCGSQPPPAASSSASATRAAGGSAVGAQASPATTSSPPGPIQSLAADAPYSALVQAASQRESSLAPAGACLLGSTAGRYVLDAEITSAVRPLPAPSDDLDDALKRAEQVEILSTWGRHGDGTAKLAVAGFTHAPPAREALALFITDRGLSLRGPSGGAFKARDALSLSAVLEVLASEPRASVFVVPEAAIAVSRLHEVLAQLMGHAVSAALAVNLAPDTTLPLPTNATARVAACHDGLPETAEPDGKLPIAQLTSGIEPLKERAAGCLQRGDARGAAGGHLSIALRISANGRVQEACVMRDELGDPGVAACVIDLARALSFGPPAPGGVIDIAFPVALVPSAMPTQALVCTLR
jgi:hypothetical protein